MGKRKLKFHKIYCSYLISTIFVKKNILLLQTFDSFPQQKLILKVFDHFYGFYVGGAPHSEIFANVVPYFYVNVTLAFLYA